MDTREFLSERRKRVVSGILGHCEHSQWWSELDRGEREALREKVLSDVATYHDIVLDVMKTLEADHSGVSNQRVLELLEQIHSGVAANGRSPSG